MEVEKIMIKIVMVVVNGGCGGGRRCRWWRRGEGVAGSAGEGVAGEAPEWGGATGSREEREKVGSGRKRERI